MPTSMRVCFHAGLMVLAYYGAARLGLLLAFAHSNVTPLWPPSGIAVAGLLLLGLRYWPVLFLSSFLVNVTTGQSAALSTTFAAGNTCEYVLAAYILRRFAFDMALRHPRDVALLALGGAFFSPLPAALTGTIALRLWGNIASDALPTIGLAYFIGDGMGILLFTPMILVWNDLLRGPRRVPIFKEMAALLCCVGMIAAALLFLDRRSFPYLTFPLAIWVATSQSLAGAIVAALTVSVIAIWGTIHGLGPFVNGMVGERLIDLQIYLAAFTLTTLSLSAVSSARRDSEQRLAEMYQHERRIALRFQEASLPKYFPVVPGLSFHCHYASGKDEALVGGDWYDVFRLPDGLVVVSIGDVSGSGLNAAVTMANMRQVIRGTSHISLDPIAMLTTAEKVLLEEYPDTMVTALVGIIDPIERTFRYASAGHPSPLLRLRDGRIHELSYRGPALGLGSFKRANAELIAIGDEAHLIFYTDGLLESKRNYLEGERVLYETLSRPEIFTSANIAKSLYDAILCDGAHDDVALLVVGFPSFRHAASDRLAYWAFESEDREAAQRARRDFLLALRSHGSSEESIVSAELVFGELLANVVRHAPGPVEMWLDRSGASPMLHVIDSGAGFSHNPKLPLDPLSESGRGLFLISALTEEFRVSRVPGKGSHAWVALALAVS